MIRIAATTVALLTAASPVAAQGVAGASATLEMRESLTVSTVRPMSPSGEDAVSQVRLEEGAYQISGDPNRAYRVRATTADGEAAPVIVSSNAGEISEGGLGRLDANGRDTIRIAPAPSRDGGGTPAAFSLTIDYE